MNREMLIRMAADILLPVGERQAMIDQMFQLVEDANTVKLMVLQAQQDLAAIRDGINSLLLAANINQQKIDETSDNAEIAATESAIAADNTDVLLDNTPEV